MIYDRIVLRSATAMGSNLLSCKLNYLVTQIKINRPHQFFNMGQTLLYVFIKYITKDSIVKIIDGVLGMRTA